MTTVRRPKPPVYERDSTEFARVLSFTDGVVAIALTLLVLGIEVPDVDPPDLGGALDDQFPAVVSFLISFVVIYKSWRGHHQFTALLDRIDASFIAWTGWFLLLTCILPFATALVGTYGGESSLATVTYLGVLAASMVVRLAGRVLAARHGLGHGTVFRTWVRRDVADAGVLVAILATASAVTLTVDPGLGLLWIALYIPVGRIVVWQRRRRTRHVGADDPPTDEGAG